MSSLNMNEFTTLTRNTSNRLDLFSVCKYRNFSKRREETKHNGKKIGDLCNLGRWSVRVAWVFCMFTLLSQTPHAFYDNKHTTLFHFQNVTYGLCNGSEVHIVHFQFVPFFPFELIEMTK